MKPHQSYQRESITDQISSLRVQFSNYPPNSQNNHLPPTWGDIDQLDETIISELLSNNYVGCLNLIETIPSETFRYAPVLHVYQAIAMLFSHYHQQDIHKVLLQAEQLDESQQIRGEIMVARGLLQSYLGEPETGEQLLIKALSEISQDNLFFRQLLQRNLGIASMIKGDFIRASQWYEQLLLSSHKLQDENGVLAAYNYLTAIRKVQGRFKEAEVIYKKALGYIQDNHLEALPQVRVPLLNGPCVVGLALAKESRVLAQELLHIAPVDGRRAASAHQARGQLPSLGYQLDHLRGRFTNCGHSHGRHQERQRTADQEADYNPDVEDVDALQTDR